MTRELIGGYPAADDREQMGRFLRYAFPLEFDSFSGLVTKNGENVFEHPPRGDSSIVKKLPAPIH